MKFKDVYYFYVFDEIKDGKIVSVFDKLKSKSEIVNKMPVDEALELINRCKTEDDRYFFWIIEEEGKKDQEETLFRSKEEEEEVNQ